MEQSHFFTPEVWYPRPDSKEILLSELEEVFPELATELIEELGIENTAKDSVLVLHPNGDISVKQI